MTITRDNTKVPEVVPFKGRETWDSVVAIRMDPQVRTQPMSAVCCLLSAVCCLLSAVCCLLSVVGVLREYAGRQQAQPTKHSHSQGNIQYLIGQDAVKASDAAVKYRLVKRLVGARAGMLLLSKYNGARESLTRALQVNNGRLTEYGVIFKTPTDLPEAPKNPRDAMVPMFKAGFSAVINHVTMMAGDDEDEDADADDIMYILTTPAHFTMEQMLETRSSAIRAGCDEGNIVKMVGHFVFSHFHSMF